MALEPQMRPRWDEQLVNANNNVCTFCRYRKGKGHCDQLSVNHNV